jgi:hypothetical protein
MVPEKAFEYDFQNLVGGFGGYYAGASEEFLRDIAKFKIACEAEEAKYLTGENSPFENGEFLLVPLEFSERNIFFNILVPDYSKRTIAVLKPYPWRMDEVNYGKK